MRTRGSAGSGGGSVPALPALLAPQGHAVLSGGGRCEAGAGPLARRWELGPACAVRVSGDVLAARCVGRFARNSATPAVFGQPLLLLCLWHVPTSVLLRVVVLDKATAPHAAATIADTLDARGARGVLQFVSGSEDHAGSDTAGRGHAVVPAACLFSVGEKLFLFE